MRHAGGGSAAADGPADADSLKATLLLLFKIYLSMIESIIFAMAGFTMKSLFRPLMAACMALAMVGCGLKGPLYMPTDKAPTKTKTHTTATTQQTKTSQQ